MVCAISDAMQERWRGGGGGDGQMCWGLSRHTCILTMSCKYKVPVFRFGSGAFDQERRDANLMLVA